MKVSEWQKVRTNMCCRNTPTDDEMLKMASQERPIQRDELGIQTPSTQDGLQVLTEGFDFLQFNKRSKLTRRLIISTERMDKT